MYASQISSWPPTYSFLVTGASALIVGTSSANQTGGWEEGVTGVIDATNGLDLLSIVPIASASVAAVKSLSPKSLGAWNPVLMLSAPKF